MLIALNLNEKKRESFLEYFHAAYRKSTGTFFTPTGSAGFRDGGYYEISLTFPIQLGDGPVELIWNIHINNDGLLKELEIKSVELQESIWSAAASKFVAEVLSAALSEKTEKNFYRSYVCRIGSDLDGEYWLPNFRFAPSMPEDKETSYLFNAERYLYIDQEIYAVDQVHGGDIAAERALLYSARLTLILDVALFQPSRGMKWVIEQDESGRHVSKLRHLGFLGPDMPDKMPSKGAECRLGDYSDSVRNPEINSIGAALLKCPVETRRILKGLDKCPLRVREAFDSCSRLYQTSLVAGWGFPTIRLAYQVGAIESIVQKAGGYKGFSDFVRREASLPKESSEFLDYLHGSVRSAHFHGGEFPLGEFAPRKWSLGLADLADHKRFNFDRDASRVMRIAIMNWVMREVALDNSVEVEAAS